MRHDNWLYNYSPPLGDYNYHYYLTHPFTYFGDAWDKVRWFYQRGSRGYADCDVWSIDWHLTSYMGKALRDLSQQVHGTPIIDTGRPLNPDDPNDIDTFTMEEWKATILYIAETFDEARRVQEMEYDTIEQYQAAHKRIQQGLSMFSEYFFSLWD